MAYLTLDELSLHYTDHGEGEPGLVEPILC
jgi:hypothetical protein